MWLAAIIVMTFFFFARKGALVPSGAQNFAESIIDFIRNDIILQTMGSEGLSWTPFLLTLFTFIFVCNIFEVIPIIQMPVTARMALPFFMTMIVFFIYHLFGLKLKEAAAYLSSLFFRPAGPKPRYALLRPLSFLPFFSPRRFRLPGGLSAKFSG